MTTIDYNDCNDYNDYNDYNGHNAMTTKTAMTTVPTETAIQNVGTKPRSENEKKIEKQDSRW